MNLNGFDVMLIGIVVRFGLPLVVTLSVIWLFRRLDAHWQAEAQQQLQARMALAAANHVPCWQQRECTPEQRAACPAYLNSQIPCWQIFRDKDGCLREACLKCDVFLTAPAPVLL
jgi:hypothetical protein